ncbi:MAG: YcxB family protein [Brevinema sp.]
MVKLSILLNKKEYSFQNCYYLIRRTTFRIIAGILLGIIVSAVIIRFYEPEVISISAIYLWIFLWCLYIFLIPHLISKRLNGIYDNTVFLHSEMEFSFTSQAITWGTSVGSHEYPLDSIHNITTTDWALIILFSPYQVIPIPYSQIPINIWEQLLPLLSTTFPKIKTKYYQKYYNTKEQL